MFENSGKAPTFNEDFKEPRTQCLQSVAHGALIPPVSAGGESLILVFVAAFATLNMNNKHFVTIQ